MSFTPRARPAPLPTARRARRPLVETVSIESSGLPNGVVVEMPQVHTAVIDVHVRAGSAYENRDNNGVSHFLEHVVLAGSSRYPSRANLQHAFDATGGLLDALTQKELTQFSVHVLPERVPRALELLAEALSRPSFAADVIESERQIVLEEMVTGNYEGARDAFTEILWGTTSIGLPIIGERGVIEALSRDDLRRAWAASYTARDTVVSVAGPVAPEAVASGIAAFADLPAGEGPPPRPEPAPQQQAPRLTFERYAASAIDIYLILRHPGRDTLDPRRLTALHLLMECYQAHVYQRLIGPELPLYYLTTGQEVFATDGCVYFYVKVMRQRFARSIDVVLREIDRIRDRGVDEDLLETSKQRYRLQLLADLADPRIVAGWVGADRLLRGDRAQSSIQEELEALDAIDDKVMREVMDDLFQPHNLCVVVRGGLGWWSERKLRKRLEGWLS